MKAEDIAEKIKDLAQDYEIDAQLVCRKIDAFLKKEGFVKGGGEMRRVDRWDRDDESLYVVYDPERNRVEVFMERQPGGFEALRGLYRKD